MPRPRHPPRARPSKRGYLIEGRYLDGTPKYIVGKVNGAPCQSRRPTSTTMRDAFSPESPAGPSLAGTMKSNRAGSKS